MEDNSEEQSSGLANRASDIGAGVGGGLGCILILAYGLAQIYAGAIGISHHWGGGWAAGAIFLCFFGGFTLPITIGSYFGAKDVWGWHWVWALIFAAPGLGFMILTFSGGALGKLLKNRD